MDREDIRDHNDWNLYNLWQIQCPLDSHEM